MNSQYVMLLICISYICFRTRILYILLLRKKSSVGFLYFCSSSKVKHWLLFDPHWLFKDVCIVKSMKGQACLKSSNIEGCLGGSVSVWQLEFWKLVQNDDSLCLAIAMDNKLSFISDPGVLCLCLLSPSMKL